MTLYSVKPRQENISKDMFFFIYKKSIWQVFEKHI